MTKYERLPEVDRGNGNRTNKFSSSELPLLLQYVGINLQRLRIIDENVRDEDIPDVALEQALALPEGLGKDQRAAIQELLSRRRAAASQPALSTEAEAV